MILLNELNTISNSTTLGEKLGKVVDFVNALSDEIIEVGKKSDNVGKIVADTLAVNIRLATRHIISAVRHQHSTADYIRKNSQKLS